jgi:hypothetical protein
MFHTGDLCAVSVGALACLVLGGGVLAARGAICSTRAQRAQRHRRPGAVDRARLFARNR